MVILDTSFLSGLLLTVEIMIYKSRIVVVHCQGCVIQRREHICSDVPNVGRAFIHCMKDILYMAAVELEETGISSPLIRIVGRVEQIASSMISTISFTRSVSNR